jgi:hypothetical protein
MAFEMAIIFLGGAPVFRFMRGWLRRGTIESGDLITLVFWVLASVSLSLLLAFFFIRKGIQKLEASSS